MSRNGSGTYNLPVGNPVVPATIISTTWANTTLSDMATALTGSVAADGQTPITGDLQMSSNRITSLGTPVAAADAVTKAYVDAGVAALGTMATQNANNVAITGGTINNTTIGATTANLGKFTDLYSNTSQFFGASVGAIRQFNSNSDEYSFQNSAGTGVIFNFSNTSGNNGTNYGVSFRGLTSNGAAGSSLATFQVSATTSTFSGTLTANTVKGTGTASAWVYFQGGSGNTAGVILGSYNVSSITVVSTGNFTVNFTTALANNNYVAVGSSDGLGGSSNYPTGFGSNFAGGQYSTTACSMAVVASNGAGTATNTVRAVFFD